MLRSMVQFVCDICKATEEVEQVTDQPKAIPLPDTWAKMVGGGSKGKPTLNLDICPTCLGAIKEAVEESAEISAQKLRNSE